MYTSVGPWSAGTGPSQTPASPQRSPNASGKTPRLPGPSGLCSDQPQAHLALLFPGLPVGQTLKELPVLALFIINREFLKVAPCGGLLPGLSRGVRMTDTEQGPLCGRSWGESLSNNLHNHMNDSRGKGWYADLVAEKCPCTPTHPAACELETFTKTHNGEEQHCRCPLSTLSCWASLEQRPHSGQHATSELTGAGVVHVPVVDQHFVKEDDAPIAGERLLGEPCRERHQRRCQNPWNREDTSVHRRMGSGPVPRRSLTGLFSLLSGKAPRDTNCPHT